MSATTTAVDKPKRHKEIYTYEAPWTIFALGASQNSDPRFMFRMAVGSFVEEYVNKVQIVQLDEEKGDFKVKATFDHAYPPTKIMWAPERLARSRDLLATTGDYLRIWCAEPDYKVEATLNNNKNSEYCAPLTSFDWNTVNPNEIGTSSIDTTCTIWDIEAKKVKTQLIAHDKEVYDIAWTRNPHIFGTVGADGSLRLFDLRSLEHSTIMYETNKGVPLLRLAWNKLDPNYCATFSADTPKTTIVDTRMPAVPVAELGSHQAAVNGVAWAPHSASHICTAGDDYQALIWDLASLPKPIEDPILAYNAEGAINQLVWSPSMPDWVTIAFDDKMQLLRV